MNISDTEKRVATSFCFILPFSAIASFICRSLILQKWCFSPHGKFLLKLRLKCRVLSALDIYSKFSNLLFFLLKSLWLTVSLLLPMNARATRRWILWVFSLFDLVKQTDGYPSISGVFRILSSTLKLYPKGARYPFLTLTMRLKRFTRPRLLTSYRPMYPCIGRHSSMKITYILIPIFASFLAGCTTYSIQDFKAGVTLPFSSDCYFKYVISDRHIRYDKVQCEQIKKRSLVITSDDWKIIRKSFQDNCQMVQCQQLVGQFDQLFLVIDKALQSVPVP